MREQRRGGAKEKGAFCKKKVRGANVWPCPALRPSSAAFAADEPLWQHSCWRFCFSFGLIGAPSSADQQRGNQERPAPRQPCASRCSHSAACLRRRPRWPHRTTAQPSGSAPGGTILRRAVTGTFQKLAGTEQVEAAGRKNSEVSQRATCGRGEAKGIVGRLLQGGWEQKNK